MGMGSRRTRATVRHTTFVALLLLWAGRAHGQVAPGRLDAPDDGDPILSSMNEPPPASEKYRWYGWQTLIADGASLAVGVTGAYFDSSRGTMTASTMGIATGVIGYAVAPPMIHWGHGHVAAGFESLGLRTGLPIALALLGDAIQPCDSTGEPDAPAATACLPYVFGGLIVGVVAAAGIDDFAIAREPVSATKRNGALLLTVGIAPTFGAHQQGVALTGAF